MSTYNKFESNLEVVVVDRAGNKTGEIRTMDSPAWNAFYSGQAAILVNWLWDGANKPTAEELSTPITFEGKEFRADYGWGSSVKAGYTFGLEKDIVAESGLAVKAEDGLRLGRWLFSNSLYGAGIGDLKVKVIKPGELWNGMPVEDGFGYVSATVAAATYNGRRKIELNTAKDSFHFWQRMKWTAELEAEVMPIIEKSVLEAANPANWLTHNSSAMDDKKALVELEPLMLEHPFVANALVRTSKEMAIRLTTTVNTNSVTRLAVPTTCKSIALVGKWAMSRHPLESWGNIRALEIKSALKSEIDRIAAMEVVQYTMTNSQMMAKGCLGIVDDSLMNGYDVVLCYEDIKMGKVAELMANTYLGFTMYWAAGSSLGISAKYFKAMNGDFDGDNVALTNCENLPVLWDQISKFPEQDSFKLPKSKNQLSGRAPMIVRSMENLVGFATNVAATTFAMEDRAFLASRLGYTDEAAMDRQLSFFVKTGTDGYKTEVDTVAVSKQVGIVQSNLATLLGKCAPWTGWRKDDWSFTHGFPCVNVRKGADLKDPANKTGIPSHFDGTIAHIARATMPNVETVLKTRISARPLNEFKNWAVNVAAELLESCGEIQIQFNSRTQVTNWTDPECVNHFRAWWSHTVAEWMSKNNLDATIAAAAMWRVAHSTRSTYAGASSVFMAFPDECNQIIISKPGKHATKTVVLGLKDDVENWAGKVTLVQYEEVRGKMRIIRKALVLPAEMMKYDKASIPVDAEAPDEGEYVITLTRRSKGSWEVIFC